MSQPKRDRSPEGGQVDVHGAPAQPRPRATPPVVNRLAFAPAIWSAAALSRILEDDGDDAAKKNNFLPPTISSCLRVEGGGPDSEPLHFPIQIDTILQRISVWWPSSAVALWNGDRIGEGGNADAIRAMIRIDTIVGGNWTLHTHLVLTGTPDAVPWTADRVSQWAAHFSIPRN
jgi:hypothetical protein